MTASFVTIPGSRTVLLKEIFNAESQVHKSLGGADWLVYLDTEILVCIVKRGIVSSMPV